MGFDHSGGSFIMLKKRGLAVPYERQRGQVLPFWVFAIVTCLGLVFFVANYTNQIRWTIRAQNAADVAGAGGVIPDADINNQIDMQLYALAVDEVRIRYLNQALVNILNGYGCGSSCSQAYADVYAALQNAVSVYNPDGMKMNVADSLQKGGLQNAESKGYALAADGCTNTPPIGDCTNGVPTFSIHQLSVGNGTADVYACKQVKTLVPAILGLSPSSTYKAIARSTVSLSRIDETFNPTQAKNPNNGNLPYVPNENPTTTGQTVYTQVNFSTFTPTVHFYVTGPVQPTASFNPSTASC
jgi:hypothetical protein